MLGSPSKRKYSPEEKQQLLANLDLEVEHRTRQLEEWLADTLENFLLHQESQISRIPRIVRNITLREFAKYDGNVQECVKGLRRELLGTEDTAIDPSTRKRKWVASQDTEDKTDAKAGGNAVAGSSKDVESSRGVKSARTMIATPKKAGPSTGPGTAQRARFTIPKTPNTIRTAQRVPSMMSPSPHKLGLAKPSLFPRHPTHIASPSKLPSPSKPPNAHPPSRPVRPPSSSTFNPMLPPSQPRWPRRDESMLSVNGSPLANPYQLGLNGYLQTVAEGSPLARADSDDNDNELPQPALRKKNSIIVRSSSLSSQSNPRALNGLHSRTNSQSSVLTQSHTSRAAHSRSNSHTNVNGAGALRTNNPPADAKPPEGTQQNPFLSLSALVSVPTKDGHVLEFDPLRTSPEELDALEGISDGAKKQAKEDMARLIQAAVERWKIS